MKFKWIKSFILVIYYVLLATYDVKAAINGKSALILYSNDASNENVISIQIDAATLNEIIAESEKNGGIVKKLNFRDLKNINELFNGRSTKFSFVDNSENSQCDISCNAICRKSTTVKPTTTTTTTTTTRKPFVTKKESTTAPPYLPPVSVTNKDDGITIPTRPTTTLRSIVTTTTTTLRPTSIVSTRNDIQTPKSTTKLVTTTTRRPTTAPTVAITRSKSTPGPAYLPLAVKSTTRASTVSRGITYPPATWPSTSHVYTSFFPTWIPPVRRETFEPKPTTTTVRYQYKEPSNFLIYAKNNEGELEIE